MRRRAGMTPGAVLSIEEGEEGTVLRTDDQHRRWLQAKVRKALEGKPWPTVDEFLADKHAETAREIAEDTGRG